MDATPPNDLTAQSFLRSIHVQLTDKIYERRKSAALEIERFCRDQLGAGGASSSGVAVVKAMLRILHMEYCMPSTSSANVKSGGLIGIAAISIALASVSLLSELLEQVIQPGVLACLADQQDPRVRYYACESMYNICKLARWDAVGMFFNELFGELSKLCADSELSVKNGADLLDRLLKDIVVTSGAVADGVSDSSSSGKLADGVSDSSPSGKVADGVSDASPSPVSRRPVSHSSALIERFIPLLAERIYTVNPFARSFLISWLSVLDSVPDLHLIKYLPHFLDGLFGFLDDQSSTTPTSATSGDNIAVSSLLSQFLSEITDSSEVDYYRIIKILIPHTRQSVADTPKLTALTWLAQLLPLAESNKIHSLVPSLLSSVLPCLSHSAAAIKRQAKICDGHLRDILQHGGGDGTVDYQATIGALTMLFIEQHEHTRICAIDWLILVHSKSPESLVMRSGGQAGILGVLLKTLSDECELVVVKDLELISLLAASSKDLITHILSSLLGVMHDAPVLVESRGALILRTLCWHLGAERVFCSMAVILDQEMAQRDLEFVGRMVSKLGWLLITADEASELRQKLRKSASADGGGGSQDSLGMSGERSELFWGLYKCWAHNPISLFSLCLLAEQYEHGCHLLTSLSTNPPLSTLVQLDKLVQLLESPVFTYLRMQLLDVKEYRWLVKALYGVLMMLPQSSAFMTLRNRLNAVSNYVLYSLPETNSNAGAANLELYNSVRALHQADLHRRQSSASRIFDSMADLSLKDELKVASGSSASTGSAKKKKSLFSRGMAGSRPQSVVETSGKS